MVRSTAGIRLIVAAYFLLTISVVLAFHADADDLQWPFLVWIGASIIGTWLIDRGWFALMPLLAIPIGAPLGYPESEFEPLPTGYVVTIIAVGAVLANMAVLFLKAQGRD